MTLIKIAKKTFYVSLLSLSLISVSFASSSEEEDALDFNRPFATGFGGGFAHFSKTSYSKSSVNGRTTSEHFSHQEATYVGGFPSFFGAAPVLPNMQPPAAIRRGPVVPPLAQAAATVAPRAAQPPRVQILPDAPMALKKAPASSVVVPPVKAAAQNQVVPATPSTNAIVSKHGGRY